MRIFKLIKLLGTDASSITAEGIRIAKMIQTICDAVYDAMAVPENSYDRLKGQRWVRKNEENEETQYE